MRKTILIADDHADTVESLMWLLQFCGYDVLAAYNGRDALARAGDRPPDFVLLDIGLPKIDGFEVAMRIRQLPSCRDAIVIAYSGHGGQKYYDRARSAGIDFYLLKPADSDILLACLDPEANLEIIAENMCVWKGGACPWMCQALSSRSCQIVKRAKSRSRSLGRQDVSVG